MAKEIGTTPDGKKVTIESVHRTGEGWTQRVMVRDQQGREVYGYRPNANIANDAENTAKAFVNGTKNYWKR